jgi:hypothetical protein
MAGFNAARNCFLPPRKPGMFPALRELELRNLGRGISYMEEERHCALKWRRRGGHLFMVAPRLERLRKSCAISCGSFHRHAPGEAEAVRREFSDLGLVCVETVTYIYDEARCERVMMLERVGAP